MYIESIFIIMDTEFLLLKILKGMIVALVRLCCILKVSIFVSLSK